MMLIGIPAAVLGLVLDHHHAHDGEQQHGLDLHAGHDAPRGSRPWIAFTPRLTPFGLEF